MTETTHEIDTGSRDALQPLLHELGSCVAAPALLLTDPGGDITAGGVSGWYVQDVRLVDRLELTVDGSALEVVRAEATGHDRQSFAYVARSLGDRQPDPTVRVERHRRVTEGELHEQLVVISSALEPVDIVLRLAVAGDLSPMAGVKQGLRGSPIPTSATSVGLSWSSEAARLDVVTDGGVEDGALVWRARLQPGARLTGDVVMRSHVEGPYVGGRQGPAWRDVAVEAADSQVAATARRSLADLSGLLLADPASTPPDRFLAAGSPWFLTLFGRDSLWAARMMLPFDSSLAVSTLRVLARRQGEVEDPATEEQPGKILHEVRREVLDLGAQVLPPVYYGSVDATPLWVCTLADAWDWGADEQQVRDLLPAAGRCLEWIREQARETGWLSYVDHTGRGLANQGWKDSHDSVQFADGRLAEAPIALSEVQAYAWEAAVRGAALFEALGQAPPSGLREWAADLRTRFLADFWVDTPDGGHVAIALDRDGVRVDSVTSNMGHVLATGILDDDLAGRVSEVLAQPEMDSGFGLRTLTSASPRFSILSYHGGSVWPHDTAIAVQGLCRHRRLEAAESLVGGVLDAAGSFDHRLPELYGGDGATVVGRPTAYPAACRPQAWSAASPLAMLVALTGLTPDRSNGTLTHVDRAPAGLGAFRFRGLRYQDHTFALDVAADGLVTVETEAGFPLRVRQA